jgi:hypothetical protein
MTSVTLYTLMTLSFDGLPAWARRGAQLARIRLTPAGVARIGTCGVRRRI